jgi:DNA polymerase III subunit epsilon
MPSSLWHYSKKLQAARKAHEFIANGEFRILDTETTGTDPYEARIVQIAVIDQDGNILVDSLLDPQEVIPSGAYNVHHISDEMVVGQPTFDELTPLLYQALNHKPLCIYNYAYDWTLIRTHCYRYGYEVPATDEQHSTCAMKTYAQFHGEYSQHHGSFTWQKLVNACMWMNIQVDAPPHSALGDCLRTLALIRKMSDWYLIQERLIS